MSRCSIVVSIPACHAGDPGSIPGNGAFSFYFSFRFTNSYIHIFIGLSVLCLGGPLSSIHNTLILSMDGLETYRDFSYYINFFFNLQTTINSILYTTHFRSKQLLIVEASPMQIEDWKVKQLHGKEIVLVKVVWEGQTDGSITWELESETGESYLTLSLLDDFLEQFFFQVRENCNILNLIN